MDVVRVGGRFTTGAQLASDLPAMIRRVQRHVCENVFHGAGPRLALAVFVGHFVRECGGRKLAQVFLPSLRKVRDLYFALYEGEVWPHGEALGLLQDAFQPQPLSGENMRQKLERPRAWAVTHL